MSHLTLVAPYSSSRLRLELAHDIRNAMAVIALHVEKLESLAGQPGVKAASATHRLLMKVTALCNDSLRQSANEFSVPRRTSFNIVETIRQVIDILRPITPAGLKIKLQPDYRHMVFGNPNDVFRIVFNLAHNVITLAHLSGDITSLNFHLESLKALTLLRITDNGPGISPLARMQLFRTEPNSSVTHGYGLLIARDLAERNGGTLQLAEVAAGTQFVLTLSSLGAIDSSTTRSLGQRAASCSG
jgi:two-component system, NtrC family, sensor histidine kinase PilS